MNLPVDYNELDQQTRRLVREEYIKLQGGNCHFCKAPLSGDPSEEVQGKKVDRRKFPRNFFTWPVHLHHNHWSGMTIGAVHAKCNAVLWQYHGE